MTEAPKTRTVDSHGSLLVVGVGSNHGLGAAIARRFGRGGYPVAIADAYWALHHQHRSAWTLELDVRPWSETF